MLTLFLFVCIFVNQFNGNTFYDIPKVIYMTGAGETATYSKNILRHNPEWDLFYEPNISAYLSSAYPTLNLSTMSVVEQTDLWRYSIVNEYGGVYLDNDVVVIKPINEWINVYDLGEVIDLDMALDMIIGIEMPHQNGKNIINPMQFVQWTFISKANNPILQYVIKFVVASIRNIGFVSTDNGVEHDMLIQEKTGPIIWTKAILHFIQKYDITNSMKSIDKISKFGQLLRLNYNGSILKLVILPRSAFCNVDNEGIRRVLIQHQFHGSWKKAPSATKISDSSDSSDSTDSTDSTDTDINNDVIGIDPDTYSPADDDSSSDDDDEEGSEWQEPNVRFMHGGNAASEETPPFELFHINDNNWSYKHILLILIGIVLLEVFCIVNCCYKLNTNSTNK